MSISYARAYMERESTEDDGPIRFVAATEGRKADGIDLRMRGAQLERFRANPVILYGHETWGRENLPIGKAVSVKVEGKRLLIDVTFDSEDPFAARVERKYRAGYMNAVSVGFEVTKWESGDSWRGGVAEEWEMHELSAVPVGLDADALAMAGRASFGFDRTGALTAEKFAEEVLAHFKELTKPSAADTVTEAKPEAATIAASEITPAAAEAFLAAFTAPAKETAE